jgi:hypothetical protein
VTWGVLALLALASFRLTRFVTADALTEPWRRRLTARYPPHVEPLVDAAGQYIPGSAHQVPSRVVVFIHCTWCVGVWTSLGLLLGAHFAGILPLWQYVGFGWPAISTVAGLLGRLEA